MSVANNELASLMRMLDLTSLNATDTEESTRALCNKALSFAPHFPAAVCVYGPLVRAAKQALKGSSVKVACVSCAFPSGMAPLSAKLEETTCYLDQGADEIDMVISRGKLLAGEHSYVFDEIAAVREVCAGITLKVILETGELVTPQNIHMASEIALQAGADFLKTSTGKIQAGATLGDVSLMMDVIKAHYGMAKKRVGIKPSGGIASIEQALEFLERGREKLGDKWLTPKLFRFGASKLADQIWEKLSAKNA